MLTVSRYAIRVFHIYFKSTMGYGDMFENKCTINDLIVIYKRSKQAAEIQNNEKSGCKSFAGWRTVECVYYIIFLQKQEKREKNRAKNTLKAGLI